MLLSKDTSQIQNTKMIGEYQEKLNANEYKWQINISDKHCSPTLTLDKIGNVNFSPSINSLQSRI